MGDSAGGRARETALRALVESEETDQFIDEALHHWLQRAGLDQRDTALATELTYGVVRHRLSLDHALNLVASRPLSKQPVLLRNILRLGAYQLMFLGSIPDHAAVNESVSLARRFGHPGLVRFTNGVLRALARRDDPLQLAGIHDTAGRLAVEYSHPQWLVRRWLDRYGERRTRSLLAAGNQRPDVTLRVNTLRTDRPELLKSLEGEGARVVPALLHPWAVKYIEGPPLGSLASFKEGLFAVQGEASMVVADALGAVPGDTVLDACAAPGGKTTHLAQCMGDRGRVYAIDSSGARLRRLRQNVRRLGLQSITIREFDARKAAEVVSGEVDRALVDAPCSNLGVLARRADARWNRGESDLARLAVLQLELLTAAAVLVRPGGTLVYSTCTLAPEENGEVVESFLAMNPDFEPGSLRGRVPDELLGETDAGYLQLYPDVHGTDGMFFARFERTGEPEEVSG